MWRHALTPAPPGGCAQVAESPGGIASLQAHEQAIIEVVAGEREAASAHPDPEAEHELLAVLALVVQVAPPP